MTPEIALYHKLLLQAGVDDQYELYLNHLLEHEQPLSEIAVELAFCMSDVNRTISILHNYIIVQKPDMDVVASLVWDDLHRRYCTGALPNADLRRIMYQITIASGLCFEEPWYTMAFFDLCWDEVEIGFLDKENFLRTMDEFLMNRTTITDPWTYVSTDFEQEVNP